jgi:hypothetical protein
MTRFRENMIEIEMIQDKNKEIAELKAENERLKEQYDLCQTFANCYLQDFRKKKLANKKLINAIREIYQAKKIYNKTVFEICAELVKGKDFTGKYLNSKGQIDGEAVSEFYREKGYRLRQQGLDVFNKIFQAKCKELEIDLEVKK